MTNQAFKDIRAEVERAGGVLSVLASTLRDAVDAERLGKDIRDQISSKLNEYGLGHYPPEIPNRQWEYVRLYALESDYDRLYAAVLRPGEHDDEELRQLVSSEPGKKLKQIRELLKTTRDTR
jgi:hypothetical protein